MSYTASSLTDSPGPSFPSKSDRANALRSGLGRVGAGLGQIATGAGQFSAGYSAYHAGEDAPANVLGQIGHSAAAGWASGQPEEPDLNEHYDNPGVTSTAAQRQRFDAKQAAQGPGDFGPHGWNAEGPGEHGWDAGSPQRESYEPSQPAQSPENSNGERVARLHAQAASMYAEGQGPQDPRQMFANLSAARVNAGVTPSSAGSALHNVAAAHAASANPRAGFASGGAARTGGMAAPGPSGGLSGTSASTRAGVWGTGRGSGSQNGISSGTAEQFAQMPQSNGSV